MSKLRIYSTHASEGAVALSAKLRDLGVDSSKVPIISKKVNPSVKDCIINWGSSKYPAWAIRHKVKQYPVFLNYPEYVSNAINKLSTFNILNDEGVSIPEYTTSVGEVNPDWRQVVCRSVLEGSGGKGITLVNANDRDAIGRVNNCKLYVQYIKKTKEYRVHVFKGTVIDVQEKRKRSDAEINYQIRNHANGWVFCRSSVNPPTQVLDEALAAIEALNLDFGAVDIVWNRHHNKAFVLEVNTAPGLEGTTVDSYANAIIKYINS